MPKYAPARESDGFKPWVVTRYHRGRETSSIIYAATSNAAKYKFRMMNNESRTVRRATPEDMENFHLESE